MEQCLVIATEQIESTIFTLSVGDGVADFIQVSNPRGRVIDSRNELQIALVGACHENAEGWQAIDSLLHGCEFHFPAAIAMFHPTVVLEKRDVVRGGLDSQDPAELVVHFDNGGPHLVSDAGALYAGIQIVTDFALVVAGQLTSQECGDILGFHRVDNRTDQGLIEFV